MAALLCAAIIIFIFKYLIALRRFIRKRATLTAFSLRDQNIIYIIASAAKSDGRGTRWLLPVLTSLMYMSFNMILKELRSVKYY